MAEGPVVGVWLAPLLQGSSFAEMKRTIKMFHKTNFGNRNLKIRTGNNPLGGRHEQARSKHRASPCYELLACTRSNGNWSPEEDSAKRCGNLPSVVLEVAEVPRIKCQLQVDDIGQPVWCWNQGEQSHSWRTNDRIFNIVTWKYNESPYCVTLDGT